MERIERIIIKCSSGYCCIDDAFNDCMIIEKNRISYSYKPVMPLDNTIEEKWEYDNQNKNYNGLFCKLEQAVLKVIHTPMEYDSKDTGSVEFDVFFTDETIWNKTFWAPTDTFENVFSILKEMIPSGVLVPTALHMPFEHEEERYPIWDEERDYLITNADVLLKKGETAYSHDYFRWAYSINTAAGLYRKSDIQYVQKESVQRLNNGQLFSVSSKEELPACLVLDNGIELKYVMENVTIWTTGYYKSFMLVTSNETNTTYIVDSRGILFQLPCTYVPQNTYDNGGKISKDRRNGYFLVNNELKVYYRSLEERLLFKQRSKANTDAVFNKEFNRFVRSNAHNENGYLYLTAGHTKCGALVSYFANNGMEYEIVPNLFSDDDTLNVRIPLTGSNAYREDVHFLCAKYENNYSIYNIPFTQVGGGLNFPPKWKRKFYDNGFNLPKEKEAMVYSVVDTLRLTLGTDDDYEVFKKSLSKVSRLMSKGSSKLKHNMFTNKYLLYPGDSGVNDKYVSDRLDYINELLGSCPDLTEKISYAAVHAPDEEEDLLWGRQKHFSMELYSKAYVISKKQYRDKLQAFESDCLAKISASGKKISRWVNESNLFSTVIKEYPNAIYQYRSEWLGMQSLDVFIPSIRVAIEYQGEQHYRPVEIFGGEEGYKDTVERDKRKEILCEENGVKLIHWKFDEIISRGKLKNRIENILQSE